MRQPCQRRRFYNRRRRLYSRRRRLKHCAIVTQVCIQCIETILSLIQMNKIRERKSRKQEDIKKGVPLYSNLC